MRQSRRRLLQSSGVVFGSLIAGCTGDDQTDDSPDDDQTDDSPASNGEFEYPDMEFSFAGGQDTSAAYTMHLAFSRVLGDQTPMQMNNQQCAGFQACTVQGVDGRTDLVGGTRKIILDMIEGNDPFTQNDPVSQVTPFYTVPWVAVTIEETGVTSIDDLDGKAVAGSQPGTGAATFFTSYFDYLREEEGLSLDVRREPMSHEEGANQVLDGNVVAKLGYGINVTQNAPWAERMKERGNAIAIPFDEDRLNRYVEQTEQGSGYILQDHDERQMPHPRPFKMPASPGFTLARNDVDNSVVYGYLQALKEFEEEAIAANELWRGYADTFSQDPLSFLVSDWPIHPGAAEFYEDNGLMRDEFDIPS